MVVLMPAAAQADTCPAAAWPLWQTYAERFVQADGRMLESAMDPQHSTSEGQSYGMLFALIGNDQATFDKLWRWSSSNLAGGDIANRLPAWLWGRGKDDLWGVQDANSASDADLWFAYALLEAARIWQRPEYRADAKRLLANIEARQVVSLPGLGKMVLPGPEGFVQPDHLWRLNASYLPVPLLRRLAKESPSGPWKEIVENTAKMLRASSPKGFVADWIGYRGTSANSGLFVVDPIKGEVGSYDAIRVYLWAGMTAKSDPLAAPILAHLDGMAASIASTGIPPEKVQVTSGKTEGSGPFGFSSALIPYFQAKGQPWLAEQQQRRVEQALSKALEQVNGERTQPLYYDYMLSLFALGWAEKRYQFLNDGTLKLVWETACPRAANR
ncbi:cellulose synthase complex periplasmic endoglucanase BcsZ [Pseudomonas sp. LS1212]|uniref:cellulose synthase complex periplasmic endoglucanase BcsZ n=1 Tax=Pseudomonas sp. LS1212 TaxID=2972478 RepID=UPI00215CF029|nr:cellulose synthase complex periplasmic endoglucanase BcsZ [Pseudomonas sp. LS1212]UVJ46434.1 cellulose synthase complex periplasmic endoglucanase BcsZ [Pseudomonas sp. LS1212]